MQSLKTDQTADVQADLSVHWSHKSYCRFSPALGHIGDTH